MAKLRHIILIVSTSLVFGDQVVPLWVVSHSLGLTLLLPPWTSVLSVLKFGVTFNVLRCLWGVSVLQVHWRTNHAWSGCCWNPCICLNHWSLLRYHIPWRWRRFTLNKWVPSSSERLRHLRLFADYFASSFCDNSYPLRWHPIFSPAVQPLTDSWSNLHLDFRLIKFSKIPKACGWPPCSFFLRLPSEVSSSGLE